MAMTIQSGEQQMERKEDESLYFLDRIWVPLVGGVRMIIIDEAHKTRPSGLLQQPEIPEWKWDKITMVLSPSYLGRRVDFGGNWDVHLPLAEFSYNNSYHSSIRCAPFKALYGRKCRSPVLWATIRESSLIGPELVQEMTDKVVLIKEKLKAKGVMQFGKKGKLTPRCVGPFEILKRIGPIAYKLRLPKELSEVHDTFHVSNLKMCLVDANLHVPLDEIEVHKTLHFIEKLVEIMDREVKTLKRSKILIVKFMPCVSTLAGCDTQSSVADEDASIGVDVRYGRATTTVTGLEAGQGSELMVFCTTLPKKVEILETDLKQTKQMYGAAYTKLIKKVENLKKTATSSQARRRARIVVSDDEDDLEDPSKQGRKITKIDQDPEISLVQHNVEIQERYDTAEKDISTAKPVSTGGVTIITDSVAVSTLSPTRNTRVSNANDITMAETLVYIRKSATRDKGKGKITESESVHTKTKLQQEQERLGFEAAMRLQAELDEEKRQRIARVHESASSFNVEEWEDIQARVEADEELVQRLQVKEREKVEARRNKPPTQAQQRTYMSNYIKNMEGYTLKQLRGYSFDEIKTLFETTMRRVNTFVSIESEVDRAVLELAAGSSKRDAKEELDQESSKRQQTGESSELAKEPRDKETNELSQKELQKMMIIVPKQGMNIAALQTKYPIINSEIYTKGTKKYCKIIKVGNHTEVHHFFDDMLKAFDRDDLGMMWSLEKEKFNLTEPTNDKEREIWVKVHHVSTKKEINIYMLVEKEYPLSRGTLTLMLVAKLLVDKDNEMSKELLRKMFMQAERPRR
nr:putative reverse transcriptase domain-containing protein [Tanacetum cinerariifolium]